MADEEHLAILQQGVEAWNTWRKEYPNVEVDLSKVNLNKMNLDYVDLKGVNLAGSKLRKASLVSATLTNANLYEADLTGADLGGANLKGAQLQGVNFKEANIFYTELEKADLRRAKLQGVILLGINLRGVIIDGTTQLERKYQLVWEIMNHGAKGKNLTGEDLSEMVLNGADLRGTKLIRANLNNTHLIGANLAGADLTEANLRKAHVRKTNFHRANLSGANLAQLDLRGVNLLTANLHRANLYQTVFDKTTRVGRKWRLVRKILVSGGAGQRLSGIDLSGAYLHAVNLSNASLSETNLFRADLSEANLTGAILCGANLQEANLYGADINGANLIGANLRAANLSYVNLRHADLTGADLSHADLQQAHFVETNLEQADLTGCRVYGISAWNITFDHQTKQTGLVITRDDEPSVTVDDLEVAQFIYLLLNREKLRNVINTITSKAVLILGRFTPERKKVLDAVADELRTHNLLPIIFDFERATTRDFTETIKTLAGLCLFVIADITNPKSAPLELQATVPDYQIPFIAIIQAGEQPFSMFSDLRKYSWVLMPVIEYRSVEKLLHGFKQGIIDRAWAKHQELVKQKNKDLETQSIEDFVREGEG